MTTSAFDARSRTSATLSGCQTDTGKGGPSTWAEAEMGIRASGDDSPGGPKRQEYDPGVLEPQIFVYNIAAEREESDVLSDAERSRAGRFRFETDRRRFVIAHARLRQ